MKVLNLYAGIGGNRKLWGNVDVVAVEKDETVAETYKKYFPQDKVIVGDAHAYLLKHFKEFDFIWSSPPCPSHSKVNASLNQKVKGLYSYPDMSLYQEIIFCKHFVTCPWVVENVIPYYDPLIKPSAIRDRHLFWSNFVIPSKERILKSNNPIDSVKASDGRFGFILEKKTYNQRKAKILRNLVDPVLGKFVFDCALKEEQKLLMEHLK